MLTTYRYGKERVAGEGLRIGAARFVPRGVRREDRATLGYFDLWMPLLSPEPELVEAFRHGHITFAKFSRAYRQQMKAPAPRQMIELIAGVSVFLPLSLGCYCEDESNCHRSILRELVEAEVKTKRVEFLAARGHGSAEELMKYASPVCFADWEKE